MALLGALLLRNDAVTDVAVLVQPEDFYRPAHAHIYGAITDIVADGGRADTVTVGDHLDSRKLLDAIGGRPTLTDLFDAGTHSGAAHQYAEIVARLARLRRTLALASELQTAAHDGDDTKIAATLERLRRDPRPAGGRLGELLDRLHTDDAIDEIPPPDLLIDGVLHRDTLSVLYGRPGAGKSFVALDLALTVAAGIGWHGRATVRGPVIYAAAEGGSGLGMRRRAWLTAHKLLDPAIGFHLLLDRWNLLDPADVAAASALVERLQPALVVVDTLSRSMPGANENAPEAMSAAVDALDRIRSAARAHLTAVHHSPVDGSRPRGHSALEGAADTIIETTRDDNTVTLKAAKQKDAEPFPDMRFRLKAVGDSCVLIPSHADPADEGSLRQSEQQLLAVLRDASETGPHSARTLIDLTGMTKPTMHRALSRLVKQGLAVRTGTDARPTYDAAPQDAA
jgi:hypothetical protein